MRLAISDYRRYQKFAKVKIDALALATKDRRSCLGYYDNKPYVIELKGADFHTFCKFKIENEASVVKLYKKFWGWGK